MFRVDRTIQQSRGISEPDIIPNQPRPFPNWPPDAPEASQAGKDQGDSREMAIDLYWGFGDQQQDDACPPGFEGATRVV
jgi:hypothetical protein